MAEIKIDERQILEIVDKKLRDIADEIFTKSQENIIKNGTSNEGFLLKSGSVFRKGELHYQINYSAPYAQAIEFGSDPHHPPVNAIERWVRLKLQIASVKRARQIAWAISKSISKRGTQPQPFLRPAVDQVLK